MPERFLQAWLLAQEGIGAKTLERVLEFFGSAQAFYEADLSDWKESGAFNESALPKLRQALTMEQAMEYADELRECDAKVILRGDELYPELLAQIIDPPPLFYVKGSTAVLGVRETDENGESQIKYPAAVAIVGSRRATAYGKRVAERIARDLANMGVVIVSGLALGIDSAAHSGALKADKGATIAVVGTGLDIVYPESNTPLENEITMNGLIISEYPLEMQPFPSNFPRRNRIISGLSLGVVVVEAAERSGTSITVGYALEQGREVFAVPGNIESPNSRGPHALIKQGARLVESADDIMEELGLLMVAERSVRAGRSAKPGEVILSGLTLVQEKILDLLEAEPTAFDHLQAQSRIPAGTLSSELMQLEIIGLVTALPGRNYIKSPQTRG